jgi:hypothetical protein
MFEPPQEDIVKHLRLAVQIAAEFFMELIETWRYKGRQAVNMVSRGGLRII